MTLIQAQEKFISRVNSCHPGHTKRVRRAAWAELYRWAECKGMDAKAVCKDASDIAALELACDE